MSPEQAAAGIAKVKEVAARQGDDLCWLYAEEILEAFGLKTKNRRAPPREEFLKRCALFHASLAEGTSYETAEERDRRVLELAAKRCETAPQWWSRFQTAEAIRALKVKP